MDGVFGTPGFRAPVALWKLMSIESVATGWSQVWCCLPLLNVKRIR